MEKDAAEKSRANYSVDLVRDKVRSVCYRTSLDPGRHLSTRSTRKLYVAFVFVFVFCKTTLKGGSKNASSFCPEKNQKMATSKS